MPWGHCFLLSVFFFVSEASTAVGVWWQITTAWGEYTSSAGNSVTYLLAVQRSVSTYDTSRTTGEPFPRLCPPCLPDIVCSIYKYLYSWLSPCFHYFFHTSFPTARCSHMSSPTYLRCSYDHSFPLCTHPFKVGIYIKSWYQIHQNKFSGLHLIWEQAFRICYNSKRVTINLLLPCVPPSI